MKFTEGYWATREGVSMAFPTEIRDYSINDGILKLHVNTRPVRHRGDTLDGPTLTFEYSSPFPDVIRTRIYHYKGGIPKAPAYELYREEGFLPDIAVDGESFLVTSGKLVLRIKRSVGWAADYLYDGKRITGNVQRNTALVSVAGQGSYIREQLDLGLDEYIYGLGERFTPFVKNGQSVDMWNEDGGTSSELSYKNVPFYLSNKGYGVFVNHSEKVSYEVGSEVVSKTQFSVPGEVLEYFVIGGGSMKSALSGYTRLTGRPSMPPAWSFGLWLTTSFTTSYDEKTVNSFIDGMAQRELPLHVFHFDCFWMKESQWCDFDWDKDVFPDPEGMLKRLKEKGLHICVWINPYIAQRSRLFDEGMKKGYLVKRPDGGVWQWDRWQAGMGLVDFTNPEAVKWYKAELKRLMDMGVDCFKTDFGERIPVDVVWHDGSDALKMHNYYSYLYNKAVFEVLEDNRGKGEAMLFARSATAGGQKFPVHWGGDCSANYDSMAESLRGGLSLCSSGFGFWSHDISGFEHTATPDIYKRWTAFGLLSSHSRLHGSETYRVPWLFDEEAVDVLRHFTKLKCRLMPYIYSTACQSSEMGIPTMRSMVMEFPEDMTCPTLDKQYMLGDSLLVAPIFNNEGIARYYLPSGTWTNLLSGERYEGGTWRSERYDYFNLPLMVKQSSVIPFGQHEHRPDYDYLSGTQFHIFELRDGERATSQLTDMSGVKAEFNAEQNGGIINLKVSEKLKDWSAVLRGVHYVREASGADVRQIDGGTLVVPHEGVCGVTIYL